MLSGSIYDYRSELVIRCRSALCVVYLLLEISSVNFSLLMWPDLKRSSGLCTLLLTGN